jgi:phosphatidylglycerol:prolipoprotein diacylglycerol transferase
VGCLLYGCDYGKPTEASWAVRFPDGSPAWQDHVATRGLPADASLSLPVHPTQLYEALGAAALFVGLLWLRARRRYSGQVFLAWVIGYGLFRPVVELFRDDKQRGGLGPLSTSQLIGILAASVGIALLPALARRARRDPAAARLWERPCPAPPEGGIKRPQREPEGP